MEKLTGNKHNHLFTDLIKVCIFGLMLLLPFLCFLPTGFYYGFNEHATNETTTQINYKYQSNEVNTIDDLVLDNYYYIKYFYVSSDYTGVVNIENYSTEYIDFYRDNELPTIETIKGNGITYKANLNNGTLSPYAFDNVGARITDNTGTNRLYYNTSNIYTLSGQALENYDFNNNYGSMSYIKILKFDFIFKYTSDLVISNNAINYINIVPTELNDIGSVETNVQDTISNKMYLAWEGVWTSPLFNWTNTTPLNTGLNGFISIFGINQSSYIANCLIYLLSITAIYVVFDIVLGMFKWLTHLLNKQ